MLMRKVGVLALQGGFAEHIAAVRQLGVDEGLFNPCPEDGGDPGVEVGGLTEREQT